MKPDQEIRTMSRFIRAFSLPLFVMLIGTSLHAQVQTGTPAFASFGGGPDTVNLANLNAHVSIPVLHKAGRGTDFTYDLSYDSAVWYPATSGSTKSWQPVSNFGWRGITEIATGYISFNYWTAKCEGDDLKLHPYYVWDTWVYHDAFGTNHRFPNAILVQDTWSCSLYNQQTDDTAVDGSGYSINIISKIKATVYKSNGQAVTAPINGQSGAASYTDRNGNQITVDSSGNFYDTVSTATAVLAVSGLGTPASPTKFTYLTSTGGSTYYQMNYTNYTVATNFGVSGISEYKSSAAVPLITSIVLPDNSQYSFTYEATPSTPSSGACTPYSGTTCVTGRVTQITLPPVARSLTPIRAETTAFCLTAALPP